jgi:hypothetical protein
MIKQTLAQYVENRASKKSQKKTSCVKVCLVLEGDKNIDWFEEREKKIKMKTKD